MVIWQKAGQGVQKKVKKLNQNNFIVYERGMGSCLCCGSAFAQQTTLKKGLKRLDSMLWQEKPQGRMRTVSSTCTGRPQLQMIAVFCDCVWLKYESRSVMNPPRRGLYLSYVVVTRCIAQWTQQLSSSTTTTLLLGCLHLIAILQSMLFSCRTPAWLTKLTRYS